MRKKKQIFSGSCCTVICYFPAFFYVSFWFVCFPEIKKRISMFITYNYSKKFWIFFKSSTNYVNIKLSRIQPCFTSNCPSPYATSATTVLWQDQYYYLTSQDLSAQTSKIIYHVLTLRRLTRTPTAHRDSSGRALRLFRLGYENQSGVRE